MPPPWTPSCVVPTLILTLRRDASEKLRIRGFGKDSIRISKVKKDENRAQLDD